MVPGVLHWPSQPGTNPDEEAATGTKIGNLVPASHKLWLRSRLAIRTVDDERSMTSRIATTKAYHR